MQFLDMEALVVWFGQEPLPQGFVEIDIIVQEDVVSVHGPDHPVGMAEDFVAVPGDEADFAFEVRFQSGFQVVFGIAGILFQDFVGHDDLVFEFDDIAAVDDEIGLPAFEMQAAGDGFVSRDIGRVVFQVVGEVPVQEEAVHVQLDGHIIPGPYVLAGFGMPEEVHVDILPVQGLQQVVGQGHVMANAIGEIDGVGFLVGNHVYLLNYYKSTKCISRTKVFHFPRPTKESLLKSVKGFGKG